MHERIRETLVQSLLNFDENDAIVIERCVFVDFQLVLSCEIFTYSAGKLMFNPLNANVALI